MNLPTATPKRLPRWLRISTALVWLVGSALVVLEIALRLFSLLPGDAPLFRHDSQTGFRMKAGARIAGNLTNSRGYNDEEWSAASLTAADRPHLAIIGDSFVFGPVARQHNFTHLLEGSWRARGDRREVFNMGLPAAGPENYLGILQGDANQPGIGTIGVVFFVGNDVFQSHPDFVTRVFFGTPRSVLRSPFLVRFSGDYFYSWKLMRATSKLTRHRWEDVTGGTFSESTHLAIERRRLEVCRRNESPFLAAAWRGAVAWLDALAKAAGEQRQRFFVVLAPDQFQVDASLLAQLAEHYDLDLDAFDLRKPQRRLGAALVERGIPVLDLLPLFEHHGAREALYRPRDTHWNRRGNELSAEALRLFLAAGE